jgi:hypothetical protein
MYLKLAISSYNTSVHEGTKYSPYELVFGRLAHVPSSDPSLRDDTNESYTEYLTNLFNKIHDTQEGAWKNLIAAKEKSKHYYDRKINPRRFKVSDKIYLLKEPRRGKLGNQYVGLYIVTEILNNNNIRLDVARGRKRTVHTDKLKLAKE